MKKVMILGGSEKSIPIIKAAKRRNYYIIMCDYNDKLETIKLVDKFYCVSVFDKESLLKIAIKENVDGVISYSSDKIALIACEISNMIGITNNPIKSIETLIRKDEFRKFLKENKYNVPESITTDEINSEIIRKINELRFPVIVKPVDSAGSTGVTKINDKNDIIKAFDIAKENAKVGKVIFEEFIEMNHECMIAGDAFVYKGKVVFLGLLNSHRTHKTHPFIPTGTSYPFLLNEKNNEVKELIQNIITDLKIDNCPLNIELMYNKEGDLYVIEIAPRNGGNLIPNLIKDTYGVDLCDALVSSTVGDIPNFELNYQYDFATTYVLRCNEEGILDSIEYDPKIKNNIYREVYYKQKGDIIMGFDRANRAIGIIFLHFKSLEEEINIINNMDKYIKINLK